MQDTKEEILNALQEINNKEKLKVILQFILGIKGS